MTVTRIRALGTVIQAAIVFILVTQSDVVVPPLIKVGLGIISVALAAADWTAIIEGREENTDTP